MTYPINPTGYFNILEQSLEPSDPVIVGFCSKCKGELYQYGPTVFEDGKRMCVNCFRDRVEQLLRNSPAIVAECLGMRYEEGI